MAGVKLLLVIVLGLAACRRAPAGPQALTLERYSPTSSEGVYLNEDLVFTFSREIDPGTVTSESFQVIASGGRPARGRTRVRGRVLRFEPEPVLTRDLTDGGYQPDTEYEVRLAGFPRLDGLRATSGEPLIRSLSFRFRTVDIDDPSANFVFEDASPGIGHRLRPLATREIATTEPILIFSEEPLDPSTLFADDFVLQLLEYDADGHPVNSEEPPVALLARLAANTDEESREAGEPSAVIELIPRDPLQPGRDYKFTIKPGLRLRDFGGNAVWRRTAVSLEGGVVHVLERPTEGRDEHLLSFLDTERFSPIAVPWAEGSAFWGDLGSVRFRYPRAAGSGALGPVVLGEGESRRDLHATRLTLASGSECELEGRGVRILRSQGILRISGRLTRSHSSPEPIRPMTFDMALSDWLAKALEDDPDWTVLIAGGDLVVESGAAIDVDTPLLLVAGGRIRIQGSASAKTGDFYSLGDGAGLPIQSSRTLGLTMDEPETNSLAEPLTFAVVSTPVPPRGNVFPNLVADEGGRAGIGDWRVRYLPDTDRVRAEDAVYDPRLLEGGGQVRLLIELTVPAGNGEPWDPPEVDYVRLNWDGPR